MEKKLLKESDERSWYLVDEFTTKSGHKARIQQCVWSPKVKSTAPSLHDHYTGYVQLGEGDATNYYDDGCLEVHGCVTFQNPIEGEEGIWVGFDMAHYGDENIQSLEYAKEQCEKMASQLPPL